MARSKFQLQNLITNYELVLSVAEVLRITNYFNMLVQSPPAEQRTVLHNISWETFEALLRDTGEHRGSRFAYDCGVLEIMTPLFEHEG